MYNANFVMIYFKMLVALLISCCIMNSANSACEPYRLTNSATSVLESPRLPTPDICICVPVAHFS